MMGFCIHKRDKKNIFCSEKESEAVRIAAANLKGDLYKVLEAKMSCGTKEGSILIGTIGVSEVVDRYIDVKKLQNEEGSLRKEAYMQKICDGKLIIAGTDRRGTIYGIYDFCEKIGISAWYFWADVPVKKKEEIWLEEGYEKIDFPSVEYRGIFINDEEELERWAQNYLKEETIGVKTYEKIFELLLRLKANYIWPAMHVNSFNMKVENGALAGRMGIVVGTSHCDMLMRSNNREWIPWITKKGYQDALYDYTLEGRNREILHEYWRESVEQNKDFEVSYTLGMRGIHDSGFETRNLKGDTEEDRLKEKIHLLETIIKNQNGILKQVLDKKPLKLFIPYKEVLELYDNGLQIPEDFTMIWANDNYGYVRRYPSKEEKNRKGGHGIYYHNSYWAGPGRSYVFICSIPLAHTKNELTKAYEEGIRKLWILNVGALKPLEQEVEFFLRLAWDMGKENSLTNNVDTYVSDWIDRNFAGNYGKEAGPLLNEFSQLANVRKIENMDDDIFSQTAYGDEAIVRIHRLKEIFDRANAVYEKLTREEKAAFFQLVLLRIHAVYITMCQYYYSDRSTLCHRQGKMQAAGLYTKYSKSCDDGRRKLLHYYNHILAEGKWNGIVTPEEFPPPRTAMHPACTPPLFIRERKMLIHLWNDGAELHFTRPGTKWLEISNGGEGEFEFEISAPDWVQLSCTHGWVRYEERITVTVMSITEDKEGVITVYNKTDGTPAFIPIRSSLVHTDCVNIEEDGLIAVSADNEKVYGWKRIERLGRGEGALLEGHTEGAVISFPVYLLTEGEFLLEIHRFPSLNSTGRIRAGIIIDQGDIQVVETKANDEWRDTWSCNSINNVDKLYLKLPKLTRGLHRVSVQVIDKYFTFSKFVIYTKERKENNLGTIKGNQELPEMKNPVRWAKDFYEETNLLPRKEYFADKVASKNSLIVTDHVLASAEYGKTKTPGQILEAGKTIFQEKDGSIKIDAVTAYMQTKYAFTKNYLWQYCNSESYGRSGLAVYIRKRGIKWDNVKEAPALNYRIYADGGKYDLWILIRIDPTESTYLSTALDGQQVSEDKLYNRGKIWRYEAEQVWRWVPFAELEMMEGEHVVTISAMVTGVRIDRIFINQRSERPPKDLEWSTLYD